MQAVILAGGLGTRLGSMTDETPKVLVPINGKPFLSHVIELLRGNAIKSIVLLVGHLSEKVIDAIGDGSNLGIPISYSVDTPELLGTGGAVKAAENLLDDTFVLLYGDCYLPIDYARLNGSPCRAVDAGCGTGKATVMLAERGVEGVGVDAAVVRQPTAG